MSKLIKLAPAPPPTNPVIEETKLGDIRMSPLMFGSLNYIAKTHRNGALNLEEVSELKQTQLRSFKTREWIQETADGQGIYITEKGRRDLHTYTSNDQFFRRVAHMDFSSLLNLRLPGEIEEEVREPKKRRKPMASLTVRQQQEQAKRRRAG